MLHLCTVYLVPVTFTLIGFISSIVPALAQTTSPFRAIYEIRATAKDITPNLEEIFVSGESSNAPYNLTEISTLTYSQTDFATGSFSSNTDPATFGLQDLPQGYIVFSGNGSNKLFGTATNTGLIDFTMLTTTGSGTVTITGGEGIFRGATGILASSQVQPLSLEIGVVLKGEVEVNGTIQTVPEPETSTIPVGMSVIVGAGILLRRCRTNW